MTLDEICSLLSAESGRREREAIDLFIKARHGEKIDANQVNILSREAKKLTKALEILRRS